VWLPGACVSGLSRLAPKKAAYQMPLSLLKWRGAIGLICHSISQVGVYPQYLSPAGKCRAESPTYRLGTANDQFQNTNYSRKG
jgi:hypothetical protein